MDVDAELARVLSLLGSAAGRDYIGEPVSQLDHALQAAGAARDARAPRREVLAALLHDVGHLLDTPGLDSRGDLGVANHEEHGAAWLAQRGFAPDLCALVRGHVRAKRYLVATRPAYRRRLSPASRATLARQGEALSEAECRAFERDPLFPALLRLRAWDDVAKRPGHRVPGLDGYRSDLAAELAGAPDP